MHYIIGPMEMHRYMHAHSDMQTPMHFHWLHAFMHCSTAPPFSDFSVFVSEKEVQKRNRKGSKKMRFAIPFLHLKRNEVQKRIHKKVSETNFVIPFLDLEKI